MDQNKDKHMEVMNWARETRAKLAEQLMDRLKKIDEEEDRRLNEIEKATDIPAPSNNTDVGANLPTMGSENPPAGGVSAPADMPISGI